MAQDGDPLAGLPKELDYIREVALKYDGRMAAGAKREQMVRDLTKSEIDEIVAVYVRMAEDNHGPLLSEWLIHEGGDVHRKWEQWYSSHKKGDTSLPEPPVWSPAENIFTLFELLRMLNVDPFNSSAVKQEPPRNWGKLPDRIAYLAAPAEKWGDPKWHLRYMTLARRQNHGKLEELESLATAVRDRSDDHFATEWCSQFSFWDHPEAERVSNLVELLRELVR